MFHIYWYPLALCLFGKWTNKIKAEAFSFQILWRSRDFYSLVHITLSFQVFSTDQMVWNPFNSSPGIIVFLLVHLPKATLCDCTGGVCHLGTLVIAVSKMDKVWFKSLRLQLIVWLHWSERTICSDIHTKNNLDEPIHLSPKCYSDYKRKPVYPERTNADLGTECKPHTESSLIPWRFKLGIFLLWGSSEGPCCPILKYLLFNFHQY